MKILQNLKNAVKQTLNIPVSVSVASYDIGKCTKCKFNINDRCTVGTHYAEQRKSRFCIEGELWEATICTTFFIQNKMEKNIGFRITIEYDCSDMIDEQTFHDKYGCDPMAAYKFISDNFSDNPLDFSNDNRVVKVELLP